MAATQLPKLEITYLQNGSEVSEEVKVIFADMVKYDILRKRFDFPPQDEAQMTWMALLAFSALVRSGKVPATTNATDFLETIVSISPVEEEAAEFHNESAN